MTVYGKNAIILPRNRERERKKTDYTYHCDSPLGKITLAGRDNMLTGLWFDGQKHFAEKLSESREEKYIPVFGETEKWLDIYFGGREPDFTPPIMLSGTPFGMTVQKIMLTIPYGHTMTYGEMAEIIARQRGIPKMSAQAVGGAVGHNPVSIIIPCHRVMGAGGRLAGYAGGTDKKLKLLELEGVNVCSFISPKKY